MSRPYSKDLFQELVSPCKKYRLDQFINQFEMARRMGLTHATYQEFEQSGMATDKVAQAIIKFLKRKGYYNGK